MNNQPTFKHRLWLIKKDFIESVRGLAWKTSRQWRIFWRKILPGTLKEGYTFAILCIKKTVYADLVIRQANSLHFHNPAHRYIVYADDVCADALENRLHSFDYPKQITVKRAFGKAELPWQHYKINMRIEVSRAGGIDIDADMIWHDDPKIDRTRPLMFAPARIFKENHSETLVITEVFKKPEWLSFTHFVSAFVSIPPQFMTEKLAEDAKVYVKTMLEHPLAFLSDLERDEIRRVSEEIGICFALQSNYPGLTKPLKGDGGRKDRSLLEPMYYGSENRVID